jgi:hypothetical protein
LRVSGCCGLLLFFVVICWQVSHRAPQRPTGVRPYLIFMIYGLIGQQKLGE